MKIDDMTQANGWRPGEPLRKHTSWRVGGAADLYCKPASIAELTQRLRELSPEVPLYWLGLGSNVLVRDGGIRGAVIATGALPRELARGADGRVSCGAGLPCALLARQCARWQLGPAAFFAGIPGSVGGALAMNAGAFGGETWNVVDSVTTIDRRGELRARPAADYTIAYRSVRGPQGEWFVGATFRLRPDVETSPATIKSLLAKRGATQPLGLPSGGSTFRNPPGQHAGRLIEQAGLKGVRIGGAVVSDKHANFILNDKDATAADIERLIEHVAATVLARCGVQLELEVRIVGEPLAEQAS
jgi:UDP-N-acetylmuramate dehydrogenase